MCWCTCDRGVAAVLVSVLLSVVLRVLQTQFMTNLERLADRPNNTHGLTLGERKAQDKENMQFVILRIQPQYCAVFLNQNSNMLFRNYVFFPWNFC